MNEEQIAKSIDGIMAALVKIQARCDAYEIVLRVIAREVGMDYHKIEKLIGQMTDACHQKRLEQAETLDPGLAARIDWRTELPDLPD